MSSPEAITVQVQPQPEEQTTGVIELQDPQQVEVDLSEFVTKGLVDDSGKREWGSGLLACLDNRLNCLLVCLCPLCAEAVLSRHLGEWCGVPCFVPGSLITLRNKLRMMFGIRGSVCFDCMAVYFCRCCVMCQMKRELDAVGWKK